MAGKPPAKRDREVVKWPSWLKWPRWLPSATTLAAWLALGIGVLGTPLLTQYYFRPDLVVSGPPSFLLADSKILFTIREHKPDLKQQHGPAPTTASFFVTNLGNTAATKIEIGFLASTEHIATITPRIAANIVHDEQPGVPVKSIRVEVERLSPKEQFTVRIAPGPKRQQESEAARTVASVFALWPSFSFVRSAEGPGRFVAVKQSPLKP